MVHCGDMSWSTELPDGSLLLSLRPEHIRLAGPISKPGSVRVRGRLLHQAFHGATELIRVQVGEALVLTVSAAAGSRMQNEVDLEFSPSDAVPVRETPERI